MKWSPTLPWSRRAKLAILTACASIALVAVPSGARAEETSYCRKVRARATGDAALLFAPTVQAQAIRFPTGAGGTIDAGPTSGSGFQARASLSWSPLDFYRGFGVMRTGDADCERGDAQMTAQRLLHYGEDYGRLHAHRAQAAFLVSRESDVAAIVAKSEERLANHVTSLLDTNELKARASELERKKVFSRSEVSRLEARGVDSYRGDISRLVADVEAKTMKFEREASHLHKLDGWDLRVTGGVVPHDQPQVFGYVQLGFNTGTFARIASESTYLDARAEELRKARYELRDQLERFQGQLRAMASDARGQRAIVASRISALSAARQALVSSESPNAPHAMAVLDLEILTAEAENVFLTTLISELSTLEDQSHGK